MASGTCKAEAPTKTGEAKQTRQIDVPTEPKSRRFTLHYRFSVRNLSAEKDAEKRKARVWIPMPSSSDEQLARRLEPTVPTKLSENVETQFGNHILHFETTEAQLSTMTIDIPYDVTRREVLRKQAGTNDPAPAKLSADERQRFLRADSMVPTSGKPLQLLESVKLADDKFRVARQLYDLVDDHVKYKKVGRGWGRGDSNWVCTSGYGNCTDFHSLFMSLARSQGLPARFEIGFSIPTDKAEGPIAGYHCWAWFYTDQRGWVPVDISEADKHPEMKEYYFGDLTADRVTFSAGRDVELVPQAKSGSMNFFVFPHIEIDGRAVPSEKIQMDVSFRDETH
jgi:transglutaminase-like putative cysteine protease